MKRNFDVFAFTEMQNSTPPDEWSMVETHRLYNVNLYNLPTSAYTLRSDVDGCVCAFILIRTPVTDSETETILSIASKAGLPVFYVAARPESSRYTVRPFNTQAWYYILSDELDLNERRYTALLHYLRGTQPDDETMRYLATKELQQSWGVL